MIDSIFEEERTEKAGVNGVVLSVEGVSKKFCRDLKQSLWYGMRDITSELLRQDRKAQLRPGEFWALDNVSFQLRQGEALGLVGPNGSGKTTLLRIISGLIKPDRGAVEIKGRIAPLIALGAGFNPILTGRENIYANMSILGLSKQQIDERFDAVVEFAEIGEAIDAPVQSYSSGMAARLGFASAIHTEPEILLIDEVLAVGDIRFQAKCHRKLSELRKKGTAFILVSHNPQVILGVCDQSFYLLKGKGILFGDVSSVVAKYEQDLFREEEAQNSGVITRTQRQEDKSLGLDIVSVCFKNPQDEILQSLISGEPVSLCIECQAHRNISDLIFRINFCEISGGGNNVQFLSNINDQQFLELSKGKHEIRLEMPYLCFKPGCYDLKIVIRETALNTLDYVDSFRFNVDSTGSMSNCLFYQPRAWKVLPQ